MRFTVELAGDDDGKSIVDIFNHYVENSFAAYPEEPVPHLMWDSIPGLQDYDLSQRQLLSQLSYPGALKTVL